MLHNNTGPVKIGHVGTNYTPPHNISCLSTGIEYFYSVTCILKPTKSLISVWPSDNGIYSYDASKYRAAPIVALVLVSGRYCCLHEVSESAIILLQVSILITYQNKIMFVCIY